MAGRWKFNESAFRAQLGDTLREVAVTEELRVKTLDACSAWLQTEGLAGVVRTSDSDGSGDGKQMVAGERPGGGKQIADGERIAASERIHGQEGTSGQRFPKEGTSGQRFLTFPTRYAAAFRIAGSIAACVLLAIMIIDVMPKTGSQAPSLAFAERSAGDSTSAAGASNAELQSSLNTMDSAPAAGFAKSALPDETVGTGDTQFAIESASASNADPSAAASNAAASNADPSADPSAGSSAVAAAPKAMNPSQGGYMSWRDGTVSALPLPEPNAGILLSVAEKYEAAHPGSDLLPERIFHVVHLKTPLTAEVLVQSVTWRDLTGTAGIWMLPAKTDGVWSVFPILSDPAEASSIQTLLGEELVTERGQDWLSALSDKASLKLVLEKATGMNVDAWTILDIQGGTGYWVCFRVDGKDWVVPFMDRPEALNLSNGVAYPYGKLKETVVPLL